MRRIVGWFLTLLLVASTVGCSASSSEIGPLQIGISRVPLPANWGIRTLSDIGHFDPDSTDYDQVMLASCDLSGLSLTDRLADLLHSDFDTLTTWPEELPDGFDPDRIMELGKDPGLNLRQLHAQGITGKGIGVAVIDQTLLVDHEEYKDRLKHYEEIHNWGDYAVMHGAAEASIAVGKTVGVAPEADLYYIAMSPGNSTFLGFHYDFNWVAKSIDRILEINNELPGEQRIRVIGIPLGWASGQRGYSAVSRAVERAEQAGVFVIYSSRQTVTGQSFNGLGREANSDPNDPNSYSVASWRPESLSGLFVPADARTTASPTGVNDYVYYSMGGLSWAIPYLTGLYALACQVNPDVTPGQFWAEALSTGDVIDVDSNGQRLQLAKVVNPVKLMARLAEGNR